ncbi:DUF3850 domain-containing protein [Burkholderia gladioli]|uniref:DUF3850 domain-containing protein n=1 Tax=Burkholderia gladioli TaxID=28095 RepID=UPI001640D848
MNVHELKSWKEFFTAIKSGARRHELRRNDRDFKVGDILLLREWDDDLAIFTGDTFRVTITSMTSRDIPCAVSAEGLHPDFCILSVEPIAKAFGSADSLSVSDRPVAEDGIVD